MTKKTFKMFAEKIKNDVPYDENRRMVAKVIIKVAKEVNPRFDETKFLKACGLV